MNGLRCVTLALALVFPSAARSATLLARGVVYYDRGHYWIEIAFQDETGRDVIPSDLDERRFEIRRLGDDAVFRPSRIDVMTGSLAGPSVILATSRIEGRSCYRVTFTPPSGEIVAVDSICDPFVPETEGGESRSEAFFRSFIAAAFRRDGEGGGLNELAYGYDFSLDRTVTSLRVSPRFRWNGWVADASAERDETLHSTASGGASAAARLSASASISRSAWASDLRCSFSASYGVGRTLLERAAGDSTLRSSRAAVEGRVRFDNLLDPINRYPTCVFALAEAAFGYAWGETRGAGPRGDRRFERLAPYVNVGAALTFFYGFRISYSLWSYWPSSAGEPFAAFHSAKLRLLLGGALEPPSALPYHPDVELVWETGRRFPLLEREARFAIGFTFDLYPW